MEIEENKHTTQDGNTVIVLKPKERLDITTSWQFRMRLQECFSQHSCHLVVNLDRVIFIDSTGLTSLVAGMRDAQKAKGSFRICNLHPEIKLVTMMDTGLKNCETEEEALKILLKLYS
ncbi:STAS domain-containing protein [Fischerella sp. PCC 9605]|uniref:STAS domain-containing protein n=1 Tax=Fischerella sp. PCC 9605 TaxID=1173024 RepID=UPI0004AD5A88